MRSPFHTPLLPRVDFSTQLGLCWATDCRVRHRSHWRMSFPSKKRLRSRQRRLSTFDLLRANWKELHTAWMSRLDTFAGKGSPNSSTLQLRVDGSELIFWRGRRAYLPAELTYFRRWRREQHLCHRSAYATSAESSADIPHQATLWLKSSPSCNRPRTVSTESVNVTR